MRALAAAFLLAIAASAQAAPAVRSEDATAQAKLHFKRGSDLYRQARYRDAIVEFEEANRLRPHGVISYNLAQCYERLGDLAAALRAYHEYLRAVPRAEDLASVNAAMANLEARLGASGVQQLLVYSDPPDAEVYVDGLARGRTPFATVLPHGAHQLRVMKPGFEAVAREALLTADRSLEIDLALKAAAKTSSTSTANPTSTPRSATSSTAAPPPTAKLTTPPPRAPSAELSMPLSTPQAPRARRSRVWTWVAGSAAVAALAAGGAYGLSAHGASADLHASVHDAATAQRLADSAASRARTANVLYAAGAAAGAAGIGLFFFEGSF